MGTTKTISNETNEPWHRPPTRGEGATDRWNRLLGQRALEREFAG